MDSLLTSVWAVTYGIVDAIQDWILTLDMGVMIGIIILTSVLKSVLSNYKCVWLTDSFVTLFLFVIGFVAGAVMNMTGATDKNLLVSAVHYSGGATLLFMLWKHAGLRLLEKVFPANAAVQKLRSGMVSTNSKCNEAKEDSEGD